MHLVRVAELYVESYRAGRKDGHQRKATWPFKGRRTRYLCVWRSAVYETEADGVRLGPRMDETREHTRIHIQVSGDGKL